MKRLISTLLTALVCAGAMAEVDSKEYRTYVKNDHHVFYCEHNGVTVVVDPTAEGIFLPHITIINESGHDFVFEPQKIIAQVYALPGNKSKSVRYRTERFLSKGDTLGFEKDRLKIYTPEKYKKSVGKSMWWANFLGEVLVAGLESATKPNESERLINDLERRERIREANAQRELEKERISEGYWRANTIFNNSEHEGFIAIDDVHSRYLILDIPVDGENFHFLIDNNKHY